MKTFRHLSLFLAALALIPAALAQGVAAQPAAPKSATPTDATATDVVVAAASLPDPVVLRPGTVELQPALGETALTLDVGNGIRFVPASRVTVPLGETLRVTGPSYGGRPVQWTKNGHPVPGATGTTLTISYVRSSDAGTYQLANNEPNVSSIPSQALVLGVGPTDRLLNLSSRGAIAAGAGQNFTTGFVVAAGEGTKSKKLILRAVGPTLATFGVANPLRAPVLRVFDAAGKPYEMFYGYPAVVGGPTYDSDLADSLSKVGAFPIPAGTLDATVMMPFTTGAYTVQVTSGDNTAGTVLVEVYEVP